MSELRKDPSPHQLLERMVRLERENARLHNELQRLTKAVSSHNQTTQRYCSIYDRDIAYAFERLANVELSVFPNLARDLVDLDKITGPCDDKANNPFDRRRPPQP
jgi:hypothetical protein